MQVQLQTQVQQAHLANKDKSAHKAHRVFRALLVLQDLPDL